ncbi:CRISPR-associated protein, Cas5a family [Pyrodictium delaneyi]|uniref:CRISPR-associated protein, Cas5a family n=1 Tax=Pyrodictium delaneyi TaxID=1273541 RepID=A0A0P0N2E5_9CREN|nr:type I-E CRISPR-associated protein Cas5/CasD [Pyrodictium delaneyi]ALL00356.1 CRISPR-associated protein, Cas5a family [Pyrodictium delaneyi]
MKPVILVSKAKLAWGFSVRYAGLSAAQPALPLPPPTTVIGFYAEPLARLLGLSEYSHNDICSPAGLLAKYTLAAGAGLDPESPSGLTVYSEVTHVVSLPYQRERKQWETYAWSVQALGASYGPSALLLLGLVVDAEGLARELGEKVSNVIDYLAWAGWRLGSKEGLVSVTKAYVSDAIQSNDMFSTLLYQDKDIVQPLDLGYVREIVMWRPSSSVFCGASIVPEYISYYLPSSPLSSPSTILPPERPVRFKTRRGSRTYCLDDQVAGLCLAVRGA